MRANTAVPGLVLEVEIRKRLPGRVADDEALGVLIDGPRWGEAADEHVEFTYATCRLIAGTAPESSLGVLARSTSKKAR